MYEARLKAGLTQMQVREQLGISQGTLSEAERTANSSSRVADFARLYGVDAGWLATGREPEDFSESAAETLVRGALLTEVGLGVKAIRPLRTRHDYVAALRDFGREPPDPTDVGYVPDFVVQGRDGDLIFVEVKGPHAMRHGEMEKLMARGVGLPGKLYLVGGGESLGDGLRRIFKALGNDALPTLSKGVAHDLSHTRNTQSLPRIRWEDLMTADLSRPFELEVADDALAPEIFKGCVALLDPNRAPEPAWPVLVRDREGNHYLRDYEAGPGGRWSVVARSRGFAPMDSEAHGLTIMAAMEGYKRPPRTTTT